DIADVRLLALAQRGGHADDDRVQAAQAVEIAGGLEAPGLQELLHRPCGHVADVGAAAVEAVDDLPVDLEAGDGEALAGELGRQGVCVDSDKKKLSLLKRGKNPIYEPGLDELLAKHRRSGALRFAASIAEGMRFGKAGDAEVVFIAVGTPPRSDGSADLSYV